MLISRAVRDGSAVYAFELASRAVLAVHSTAGPLVDVRGQGQHSPFPGILRKFFTEVPLTVVFSISTNTP